MSKENIVKCPKCGAGVIVPSGKKLPCPICSTECKAEVADEGRKRGGAHAGA